MKFNEKDEKRRAKYGQNLLEGAVDAKKEDRAQIDKTVKEAQGYIRKLMEENNVEAIAFKDGDNVEIPCIAGFPIVTVPFGENDMKDPTGMTFFGMENDDEKIINIAYAFEQATNKRMIPKKYMEVVGK